MITPDGSTRKARVEGREEGVWIVGGPVSVGEPWAGGWMIRPPDVWGKTQRAVATLRARGWVVDVELSLRIGVCVEMCSRYASGEILAEEVIVYLGGIERAIRWKWWPGSIKLTMGLAVAGVGKRKKTLGGYRLLRRDEWDEIQAGIQARDRRIQALLRKLEGK